MAELYHRYRPSYPPALLDDLIETAGLDGSQAVLEVDFEAWPVRGRRFPLIVSGQAWHWVTPAVG